MEEQGSNLDQRVNLEQFAEMAGFPVELVKKELLGSNQSADEISMEELRSFMLKYLDKAMIEA